MTGEIKSKIMSTRGEARFQRDHVGENKRQGLVALLGLGPKVDGGHLPLG